MNRLECCLLAFIITCFTLTVCAQCYHAGYQAGYHAIETEANQQ